MCVLDHLNDFNLASPTNEELKEAALYRFLVVFIPVISLYLIELVVKF